MPDYPDHLTEGMAELSRLLVNEEVLDDTLQRVADLACRNLGGADVAGVTLLRDGKPTTAVFTDPTSPEIDSAQYETGIGPCLDAFRHREVFVIDDTEKDDRWRPFSEAAAANGIRSTLSLPLVANHEGVGALNFYSREASAFSDHDVEVGSQFATQAAIVLANAQAYWDAHQLSQNMATAMKSRATIEQAKGILMGAQSCSADEAFEILVRASQRENRKLREVAEDLVTRVQQAAPRPPTG